MRTFRKLLGVIPSHQDLYGREATRPEVVDRLQKYPVIEWLSVLARMQNILAGDRHGEIERIHRVLCGTMSAEVHEKLREFESQVPRGTTVGLYYERQMSTLQQLAILHAPEGGALKLDNPEGRNDLSMALLMTADLMRAGCSHSASVGSLLPIVIQDQIRMATTPPWVYAARAFHFYELSNSERSATTTEYLRLFSQATGADAVDFILGGLDILIREESRDFDELARCWHAVPRPEQCENALEAEVLGAYEAVRMRPLGELRALIEKREGRRPVRDWNLIALAQAPICDLGDVGAFALNRTVLGRSLFDSVRHAILTGALDGRLSAPYNDKQAIGNLYGKVFEAYVLSILETAFPGQVYRIPERSDVQRADVLIWFPDKIIVAEIKGVHFVGLDHGSFHSIEERRQELRRVGIPHAISQVQATVRDLRKGKIPVPKMPDFDWTITRIIPLIITEEQMPWVPGCWDAFYDRFSRPFKGMEAAGPLTALRLLTVKEVEELPDLELPYDFATMLTRWAANPRTAELTWGHYLTTQAAYLHGRFMLGRFFEMVKYLARRLDLDESQLTFLEDKQGGLEE